MMFAFIGPSSLDVNHKDGIKTNNQLDNLEYCTRGENVRHAIHVLKVNTQSIRGVGKKLDAEKVEEIKVLIKEGIRQVKIASLYGVTPTTIWEISIGKKWGWIAG